MRTAPPSDDGMPDRFSRPARPALCAGTASVMSDTPPPATTSGDSTRAARKSPREGEDDTGETRVGDEEVRPLPERENGQPRGPARAEKRGERVRVVHLHEVPGGPADPKRRPAGKGDVLAHDRAQAGERAPDHRARRSAAPASAPATAPARTSSIITPQPPGSASSAPIGPGFHTSRTRKRTNAPRTAPIPRRVGLGRHERVDRQERDGLPRDLVHDHLRRIGDPAEARRLARRVHPDERDREREAEEARDPADHHDDVRDRNRREAAPRAGSLRKEARPEPRRDGGRHARRREHLGPGAKNRKIFLRSRIPGPTFHSFLPHGRAIVGRFAVFRIFLEG